MARKPATPFPPDCCGACHYCTKEDRDLFLCWVSPPIATGVVDEESGAEIFTRGVPIDTDSPPCLHFRLRINA